MGLLTISLALRIVSGCGGCNIVCCSPRPGCKAPRNTDADAMHWLDKKNVVHTVKKGELIPHYSKIAQVYLDSKWVVFTPTSDMKAAQDACRCVEAVRLFLFSSPMGLHQSVFAKDTLSNLLLPFLNTEYLLRPPFSWFMIVETCKPFEAVDHI